MKALPLTVMTRHSKFFTAGFAIIVLFIGACASTSRQGEDVPTYGAGMALTLGASLQTWPLADFTLHYAESGEAGRPTVVFIHGTPGSWRALGRLLGHQELLQRARLIAIDRPGWGGSSRLDREDLGSFVRQAELMSPLLEQLKRESGDRPLILVGHSLGASYAPYLAYRNPGLVDGVLMAAGAIDPDLGKPRWYNHAARIWPISSLIDRGLQKANAEIWGVHEALTELEPWWQTADIPLTYVQGEDDELVDPRNLDYAERSLPPQTQIVRLPNQGHFLHRQRSELIAELTLQLLESIEEKAETETQF